MSEENLAIVRRIYAEYAGDPDAVRDAYRSDFEFDVTEIGPDIGIVAGFDAATEAMRPYFDSFDDFRMEIDEVLHADDRHVVVAMHDTGRMHGSDFEVTNHRVHVWTFRDGKVVRFSSHLDPAAALEAAGLSD
jgi:ketosteroid isomerase-like protein